MGPTQLDEELQIFFRREKQRKRMSEKFILGISKNS